MTTPTAPPLREAADPTREAVLVELERADLSQAAAAREIGVSASTLSAWLLGRYAGDNANITAAVRSWLDARAERDRWRDGLLDVKTWVETPTARRIMAALSYARGAADVALIHGVPGVGKTLTARRYCSTTVGAWMATMSPAARSVCGALERVADALRIQSGPGTGAARLEAEILARVTATQGILVVDEAQHLTIPALDAIRGIHDAAGIGLALIGGDALYARVTGGGGRTMETAQLYSRIGKRVRVVRAERADMDALIGSWEIEGALAQVLRDTARGGGALRTLAKTVRLARMFAGDEPLTHVHVESARRDLGA